LDAPAPAINTNVSRRDKHAAVPAKRLFDVKAALASFVRLSAALVGEETLPDDLAAIYFAQAKADLKDKLGALLTRFDELSHGGKDSATVIRDHILPDPDLGAAARVILALWYTGGIQNAAGDWEVVSADRFYRALVWDAIGAHPPTLSNGYYGHWKYPPEQ
jgi:hypothetical protein